jgi:hypothetical protein
MMKRLIVIGAGLMLAGCQATGPVSSPEFNSLVTAAMPPEAGSVMIVGPGNWYPNTNGFTDIMSTFLAPAKEPIPGVVAVGTSGVIFCQWDDRHNQYVVMKLDKFEDIADEHVDTYGLNARLVLKRKDYTIDSFDFSTAGGQFINRTRAHDAGAYLAAHLPPGVGHPEENTPH